MAWALGLALVLATAACARRPLSPPPPDPVPMDRDTYVIGVNDRIQINVWRNQELNATVPVRTDGKISVALLDDVQAEGLTPMELKEVLTRELGEYIAAPDVTVLVVESNSRVVSVLGQVRRNGRIALQQEMRVTEAIAASGGFDTYADRDDVRIVRRNVDGSEVEYRFDYDSYIKGNAPGTNIVLQPGDTIIVPE